MENNKKTNFNSILNQIQQRHEQSLIVFLISYMGMAVANTVCTCIYYIVLCSKYKTNFPTTSVVNVVLSMICLFSLLGLMLLFLLKKDDKKFSLLVTLYIIYLAVKFFLNLGNIASDLSFYKNESAYNVFYTLFSLFTLLLEAAFGFFIISAILFPKPFWLKAEKITSWLLILQASLTFLLVFIGVCAKRSVWINIFNELYFITEVAFLSVTYSCVFRLFERIHDDSQNDSD